MHLYRAYEYIVSFFVIQVKHEQEFSKQKIIKNCLHLSMGQECLEAYVFDILKQSLTFLINYYQYNLFSFILKKLNLYIYIYYVYYIFIHCVLNVLIK